MHGNRPYFKGCGSVAECLKVCDGGEGGIRTHGTHTGATVFETVPIDRSGTSPASARSGAPYRWHPVNPQPIASHSASSPLNSQVHGTGVDNPARQSGRRGDQRRRIFHAMACKGGA